MLINSLVLVPSHLLWNWTADYYNQTAGILSKDNVVIVVLWAEKATIKDLVLKRKRHKIIREEYKNLWLFTPIYPIPFLRFSIIEKANVFVNMVLLKIIIRIFINKKFSSKILWIFYPEFVFYLNYFKDFKSLYDCVDYYDDLPKNKLFVFTQRHAEAQLSNNSLRVFANSQVLLNKLSKLSKDIKLVPQGFSSPCNINYPTPMKIKKIKRPVVGYAGGINDRLDYCLLYEIIKNNSNWNFVFWGPIQTQNPLLSDIIKAKNVYYGKSDIRDEVYSVIRKFDIGMLPYDPSIDFNKYCYPMKLFEYLYMGKPVISTPIQELELFLKYVTIVRSVLEWEKSIKKLLLKPWPNVYQKEQRRIAEANSWENKLGEITTFMH